MGKTIIPFDAKYRPQIESGEMKVMTSVGEPAEIVKWNCRGNYPILAVMFDGDTDDSSFYTIEGKGYSHPDINYLVLVPVEQESEDERIRKGLLEVVSDIAGGWPFEKHSITKKDARAWLEKQKEHQFCSDAPKEKSVGGNFSSSHKDKNLDEIAQDYVDGVKEYNPEPTWDLMQTAVCYGYHLSEEQFEKNRLANCDALSKEECDRETDFAMEIIEKEHRQPTFNDAINYGMRLQKEQKPSWSEEDEAMRDNILRVLDCFIGTAECESNPSLSTSYPVYQREIDWLKSLPEKFGKPADLPKWRIASYNLSWFCLVRAKNTGGYVCRFPEKGDSYIHIADLEKLPKEEEK